MIPFFPLLGAAIAVLGPKRVRELAHIPVAAGIALAFLVSLGLLFAASPEKTVFVMRWLTVSELEVPIEFRIDGLTTMMLSMVTFVSTLVAVFAAGYMAGDPAYPRFFALIGLFVASMTGLVLSNNYLLTYVFWEGVGVCSYLLVGFWHTRPKAAAAAMKAFLVNRIGDFGFAIAIFWMWSIVPNHDLSYGNVLSRSDAAFAARRRRSPGSPCCSSGRRRPRVPRFRFTSGCPTRWKARRRSRRLIHAATMVTAGVYLIARSMPLFTLAPWVLALVSVTGCATALLAASIAVTQNDLKRVMAYSTVSQLGYMFMALGAGVGNVAQLAVVAAMFHLFTHAFFKALLFLASGSVMHAMGDVIDMRRFRGLRHRLPYTCCDVRGGRAGAFGGLSALRVFQQGRDPDARSSRPPESARELGLGWHWVYYLVYLLAILTSFMTAFYTGRAFFMTFWGPEKLPSPDDPEVPASRPGERRRFARPFGIRGRPRATAMPTVTVRADTSGTNRRRS